MAATTSIDPKPLGNDPLPNSYRAPRPLTPTAAPTRPRAAVPWARPEIEVPRVAPPNLVLEASVRAIRLPHTTNAVWTQLLARTGALRGALWPYRVEFSDTALHAGCARYRYGPLVNLPGVLTRVKNSEYIDLQYCAGAWIGSPRWLRPKRLEFRLQPGEQGTTLLVLRLEALVHPLLRRPWRLGQRLRWKLFAATIHRGLRR